LLGIDDFKASEGWLSKFKQRHGIVFKQAQGKAGDIDLEKVEINVKQFCVRNWPAFLKTTSSTLMRLDSSGSFCRARQ
jgi:hypothetical protein